MPPNIHGIVLAGGKATRMHGLDKGLVKYQGSAMIAHVLARLRPQVKSITICANRNIETYQQYHQNVIIDDGDAYRGPLVGILSAMSSLSTSCHADDWVLLAPCDAPLFASNLRRKLVSNIDRPLSDYAALLPFDGQRLQCLFSMLPLRAIDKLHDCVDHARYKVSDCLQSLQPEIIDLSEIALSFKNINSLEQLNAISNDDN